MSGQILQKCLICELFLIFMFWLSFSFWFLKWLDFTSQIIKSLYHFTPTYSLLRESKSCPCNELPYFYGTPGFGYDSVPWTSWNLQLWWQCNLWYIWISCIHEMCVVGVIVEVITTLHPPLHTNPLPPLQFMLGLHTVNSWKTSLKMTQ